MFRSNLARAWLPLAALVLAGACGDDGATTTPTTSGSQAPTTASTPSSSAPASTTTSEPVTLVEVTYAGGQVAGGAQRTTVARGAKVRIRVTSDVVDEIHVHTYDLRADVAPGQPGQVDLVASIPGRHEVELEKKRTQLLVLEVR